jgi:hypothetical protein
VTKTVTTRQKMNTGFLRVLVTKWSPTPICSKNNQLNFSTDKKKALNFQQAKGF